MPHVDLFILGTGERLVDVNPSLYGYFSRKGISVEPMSTVRGVRTPRGPACHTTFPPPIPQMHAIAQFNALCLEGRRVAVGLISRSPMSRDDACLYAHGGAVQTAADRRLEAALANDAATVTAAAAAAVAAAPLQIAEGVGGSSGVAALSALSLRRSVREAGALERAQQQARPAAAAPTPPVPTVATPSPQQHLYGVEIPAATAASPQQQQQPDERALAAEERRRVAQRPETGEDMMDALAQRSQRRSAVARRRGGGAGEGGGDGSSGR